MITVCQVETGFRANGSYMLKDKINISIFSLAVLPVDYLGRLDDPFDTACAAKGADPCYRDVFSTGIRAYQFAIYLQLVRKQYGRGVANQIGNYQWRLLQPEGDVPSKITRAIELVRGAIESESVTADTGNGSIEIPIEMNVAIALLLGMPCSPHFAAGLDQRVEQVNSMGMDIDWSLSRCLEHARQEIEKVFTPLLACISSGVRLDYVQAYHNEQHSQRLN